MAVAVTSSAQNPDVRIVTLSGRLDMETAEADSPAVMEAVEQSAAGIAIDMAGVQFLSSSGLRLILAAHQRAENSRKKMALVRVQPAVYKIFKVSALDGKFRFFETETEAVDSLTS